MVYFLLTLTNELSALEMIAFVLAYFLSVCIAMTFHEFSHA